MKTIFAEANRNGFIGKGAVKEVKRLRNEQLSSL